MTTAHTENSRLSPGQAIALVLALSAGLWGVVAGLIAAVMS